MKFAPTFVTHLTVICLIPSLCFSFHDGEGGPKDIGNSAAPGIGGNGPYESLNMDLLAHLPLNEIGGGQGNVLGSDCWGWTDPDTGKEYAISGLTNRTSFIDISEPTDPKYLGSLLTQTGNAAWRDMKIYNNYVFVVSDGNDNHGMQVFDLTELRTADPNNPQTFQNSAWYSGVTSAHNVAINEDSGFAYIVGSNQASGGLHVVDIRNPLNPVAAGNFSADGYTHDVQVVNYAGPDPDYFGREVAFAANEDTLTIVDVTNKNNMVQISRNGYAQDAYTHQCWLSEDHRFIYLGDELDEPNYGGPTRTHVWDLLNLDNPVYRGYYLGTTTAIDHNMYVKGNRVYQANYSVGLRVLEMDENDPALLTEVAFFDTYVTDNDTDFDGAWSCYPYFDSGVVIVNDRQNGLFIVRLSGIHLDFPNGRPDLIDPDGGTTFQVAVTGFINDPEPNTGVLHVDRGNGFESFPMTETSPNMYDAIFPTTLCGEEVNYYVSAMDTEGNAVTNPSNAPLTYFTTVSGDSVDETFSDDFETNQGWTVTGNATTGQWERGVPAGDGDRGDPGVDGDGSGRCYLTGNAPGDSDIDDGSTVLTSPLMDAIGSGNGVAAMLSYYRWYSNDIGNAPASDIFVVDISNDDGETWVNLETVGPGGSEVSGGWFHKSFRISDFVVPTDKMRIRFTASDLGDASVVEAAVDGIQIEVIECDPITNVTPDGIAVIVGSVNSGGVPEITASDDQYAVLDPEFLTFRYQLQFTVDATSPTDTPSAFEFSYESRTANFVGTVDQEIELFNYVSGSFETVDSGLTTSTDTVVTVIPGGDPARFVQAGTGAMQARIYYQNSLPFWVFSTKNLYLPYRVRADHIFWSITP